MSEHGGLVLRRDELPRTAHAHEFIGAEQGDVPFSLILVEAPSGAGPRVHRHPYAEVFLVEQGTAEFQLGGETFAVEAGSVVIGPPNVPHGFRNAGTGELHLTAIHGAPRFVTEWLAAPDGEAGPVPPDSAGPAVRPDPEWSTNSRSAETI